MDWRQFSKRWQNWVKPFLVFLSITMPVGAVVSDFRILAWHGHGSDALTVNSFGAPQGLFLVLWLPVVIFAHSISNAKQVVALIALLAHWASVVEMILSGAWERAMKWVDPEGGVWLLLGVILDGGDGVFMMFLGEFVRLSWMLLNICLAVQLIGSQISRWIKQGRMRGSNN